MRIDQQEISCIVLGASLGGVEAINTLVRSLKKPLPVPLLITLHIPPHTDFVRGAYIAGDASILIKEAEDKEAMSPGTIYFAPSDYHLLVEKTGSLSLSSDELVCFARPSIDVMFESAAMALGNKVFGILLTGANEDGAKGIRAIGQAKGLTWVQDPGDAHSPQMPESALKLMSPGRVLSIQDMVRRLAEVHS